MIRPPPISTRTATVFPDTTLFRSEVAANRLAGVVVAPAAQCRVVGDPDAAAGDAGGATELLRLLDHEDTQALFGCGQGRGHPAAAGADDDEVEILVEVLRRSEEHTSELQSLMRSTYAVFCLKKKKKT